MTTYGEPRLWLDQFPLGEPQFFEQEWNGILYPGEILTSDIWPPELGEPLSGNTHFRVVLMVRRPDGPAPSIADSRIALCLPGSNVYRQRSQLVDELSTIREAEALYLTQRDPESELIRRTLRRRQEGLEEELITHEVERYSSGTFLSRTEYGLVPNNLFTGTNPASWFANIARWLLSQAYPNSPIAPDLLPRSVRHEDPSLLFQAIFGDQEQMSDSQWGILGELGPGLGLSSSDNPTVYDFSAGPVLDLVRVHMSEQGGVAGWPELHQHLAHEIGLTSPLATLFMLVYLHQARPELELRLADNHQLSLEGSRTLTGTRLTGDLLRRLAWDSRIEQWGMTLGPLTQPHWDDALPYLTVISPELSPVGIGGSIIQNEQQLLRDLSSLSESVHLGQDLLELVGKASNEPLTAAGPVSASLQRVLLISGDDFQSVYASLRNTYTDYKLLEEDLVQVSKLADLARSSKRIQETWEYLINAPVPTNLAELSVERQSLAAAVAPDSLLTFSRSWNVLARQIDDFKGRYSTAYLSHHHEFNQRLTTYRLELDSAKLKLRALDYLDELPELGPPTGVDLPRLLEGLETERVTCYLPANELALTLAPRCPSCGLTLEESLDTNGLARAIATIDGALSEKNRSLSNLLVDKILKGHVDQRLEDFLKIVQASDLSALSNTISEEMNAFLRRLLA